MLEKSQQAYEFKRTSSLKTFTQYTSRTRLTLNWIKAHLQNKRKKIQTFGNHLTSSYWNEFKVIPRHMLAVN